MADARTPTPVLTRPVEGISTSERPVRFSAGDDEIFGVFTEPLVTPRGIGVVLCNATSDRNRFIVRFARRLAGAGFHVLRFDYQGFAESSGRLTGTGLKHAMITLTSPQEPFTRNLLGAVSEMRRRGVQRIAVVGRCFGARTALSGLRQIPDLVGMALLSLPLHGGGDAQHPTTRWALDEVRSAARLGVGMRVLRGMFNPRRRERWMRKVRAAAGQLLKRPAATGDGQAAAAWVSEAVVGAARDALDRGVPLLFVYGRLESVYRDFQQAQAGPLAFLGSAGDRVTVALFDGPANNLTNLKIQEDVMNRTQEWLEWISR